MAVSISVENHTAHIRIRNSNYPAAHISHCQTEKLNNIIIHLVLLFERCHMNKFLNSVASPQKWKDFLSLLLFFLLISSQFLCDPCAEGQREWENFSFFIIKRMNDSVIHCSVRSYLHQAENSVLKDTFDVSTHAVASQQIFILAMYACDTAIASLPQKYRAAINN